MLMLILIIIFSLPNTQNYMSLSSLNRQKTTKNYQIFLAKGLEDHCIGINIKQNVRLTVRQTSIDIFLNQTLSELTDCLFQLIQTNAKNQCDNAKRHKNNSYYLSKCVIKNYNLIINGKKM